MKRLMSVCIVVLICVATNCEYQECSDDCYYYYDCYTDEYWEYGENVGCPGCHSCLTEGCPAGMVCGVEQVCQEIVADCPLTDECLPDPEGYNPFFIGQFFSEHMNRVIEVHLDFYQDHFYGEGLMLDAFGLQQIVPFH